MTKISSEGRFVKLRVVTAVVILAAVWLGSEELLREFRFLVNGAHMDSLDSVSYLESR